MKEIDQNIIDLKESLLSSISIMMFWNTKEQET